jgi:hypothetical protein
MIGFDGVRGAERVARVWRRATRDVETDVRRPQCVEPRRRLARCNARRDGRRAARLDVDYGAKPRRHTPGPAVTSACAPNPRNTMPDTRVTQSACRR